MDSLFQLCLTIIKERLSVRLCERDSAALCQSGLKEMKSNGIENSRFIILQMMWVHCLTVTVN